MDTPSESPASESNETPAQRQARLRRERRNAKIQAGGSTRLQAITSLSGRAGPPAETQPTESPSATPIPPAAEVVDDPEEIDISQHYYTPQNTARSPPSGPQSTLQSFDSISGSSTPFGMRGGPGAPGPDGQAPSDDPMVRMMQQMMGNSVGDLPPALQQLFGGSGGPGGPGQPQQQEPPPPTFDYIWRIIHALFSFALAIYVTTSTTFTGSKAARERSGVEAPEGFGQRLFMLFATAEVALQSTRYFMEKGRLPASGFLGKVSSFLPQPYGGYVRVIGRYSIICTTVISDAMAVVFVLGALAWWNGMIPLESQEGLK